MIFTKLLQKFVAAITLTLIGYRLKSLSQQSLSSSKNLPNVTKKTNFYFVHVVESDDFMPLAITRYTSYDDNDKVLNVEQVIYENDLFYLETEVAVALQHGVDVSLMTCEPFSNFPSIEKLIEQAHG